MVEIRDLMKLFGVIDDVCLVFLVMVFDLRLKLSGDSSGRSRF